MNEHLMSKHKEYHYNDILLLPNEALVDSREQVSTWQTIGNWKFKLPIIPANMKTIIDFNLAKWLTQNGYFYVMHRFGVDIIDFAKKMQKIGLVSISVGVNQDSIEVIKKLKKLKIKIHYITIDIAHGHCDKMKKMIALIKENLPDTFVIAGNVCTGNGVHALESWGADATKVGIGSGKVCITKLQTGFSRPQFSAVLECAAFAKKPIISDGGITQNGDIAKALVAGASWVMTGNLVAGFEESPGKKIIYPDGRIVKEYFGSASEHNKGVKEYVEGCKIEIPYRGSIVDKYKEIDQSLRSSISYAGGRDLKAFKKVNWVVQ